MQAGARAILSRLCRRSTRKGPDPKRRCRFSRCTTLRFNVALKKGGPHHRRRFEARQVGCNPSRVGRADPANIHLDEREDAEATRAAVEKEGARCVVISAT